MPKQLEPAFIQQLQDAANQGHVVVIPAPIKPQRTTTSLPLLRARSEAALAVALCLMFKLGRSEGQMLAKLMACDYCTEKDLQVAANRGNEKVALSTVRVLISQMRTK